MPFHVALGVRHDALGLEQAREIGDNGQNDRTEQKFGEVVQIDRARGNQATDNQDNQHGDCRSGLHLNA